MNKFMTRQNILTKNPLLVLIIGALMVVFSVTYFTIATTSVTTIGTDIEAGGNISASDPTEDEHVATKGYVDASGGGGGFYFYARYTHDGSSDLPHDCLPCPTGFETTLITLWTGRRCDAKSMDGTGHSLDMHIPNIMANIIVSRGRSSSDRNCVICLCH